MKIFSKILKYFLDVFRKIKEKKEKEEENVLISKIFFVRHGRSAYKEYLKGEKNIDLCPEGIKQIKKTANLLLQKIDNKLPVYLTSSPRVRTMNSAKIIKESLAFHGIEIVSDKIFESKKFEAIRLDEKNLGQASSKLVMNYLAWISDFYSNETIESYDSFFERIKNAFEEEICSIRNENKYKQIVVVSHGEVFDAFMLNFKLWKEYDHKNSLKNGEIVEICIYPKKVSVSYDEKKSYILEL